jgi:phospholipid-binding lipoprotein MlaA
MLNEASIDKYAFLRDAYLQRRRSQIFDGNPPDEDLPDQSQAPSQSSKEAFDTFKLIYGNE